MPNCKGAEKRLRQNVVRKARNKAIKSSVKTSVKKVLSAVDAGDVAAAEEQFKTAAKKLDQAGAKGVIHKNAASRKKSRLQSAIKKAKAS